MEKIYTIPFKVRSYEVDRNEKVTFSSICNYFQETAGIHAHHLNFDISQLHKKGLTWVLYKMHIKLLKQPKRWEEVEVTTWPSAGDGLRAFRDYEMKSGTGELLAHAISQWMVLDMKTKRPVRTPKEISEMGIKDKPHTIEPERKSINPLSTDKAELITIVGRNDLDMNHHVNNVRYIDWMTGYPADDHKGCREMEIQYLAESVLGDTIYHTSEIDGNRMVQSLFKNEEKKPIASSISYWD
ncbi:acyl-[acyl-carrier-protein] thioesterase [Rhodohalobacter halophilus]|uniref:acyl-[acyl-carrier-protein] thioesterase n=1 Tax=Rhodohalobacter halophilus TaxID=1812810 RepID=UPI00083F901B|nr:acyl-ACP thioesterase domain-containing protein [Rhodohalobacter halophilus]